jgi:hypothetical protein
MTLFGCPDLRTQFSITVGRLVHTGTEEGIIRWRQETPLRWTEY